MTVARDLPLPDVIGFVHLPRTWIGSDKSLLIGSKLRVWMLLLWHVHRVRGLPDFIVSRGYTIFPKNAKLN